jgi:hypothetical protein
MPHVLGPVDGPPPPTSNETLLREAVDRLRLELDECRSVIALHQQNGCGKQLYAEGLQNELRAAREVYAELGPVLEPLRAMHGRHPGTRIPPCGWCRLIFAYDKAIKAMGGK